jgi:hypothetical protein
MTGVGSKTFTSEINTYIQLSEGREPKFDKLATAKVLSDFMIVASNVDEYYHTKYSTYIPSGSSTIELTTFDFMFDKVATAAILGGTGFLGIGSTQGLQLASKDGIPSALLPIANFFVDGTHMRYSINDTHQMFTYYTALKYKDFNLGGVKDGGGSI